MKLQFTDRRQQTECQFGEKEASGIALEGQRLNDLAKRGVLMFCSFVEQYLDAFGGVRQAGIGIDPNAQRQGVIGITKHARVRLRGYRERSEEHTSELQSLMRISYAVFCLKKKKQ